MLYGRSRSWGFDFLVNKWVCLHFSISLLNPFISNFFLGEAAISNSQVLLGPWSFIEHHLEYHLHVWEIYNKACSVSQSILRETSQISWIYGKSILTYYWFCLMCLEYKIFVQFASFWVWPEKVDKICWAMMND